MGNVVIIGTGPAGLACAYKLGKMGHPVCVIEKDSNPGGLCQTINYKGFLFDIGGHRFLTKSKIIQEIWHEIIRSGLQRVIRLSRLYYRNRFFDYPLSFFKSFWNLGIIESFRCLSSYFYSRITKPGDDKTFEGWIINRFGRRIHEIFFESYTEKVWGIPCNAISSDWAIQRIQGLSLRIAIQKALIPKTRKSPKTLSKSFFYPRKGPGEFFDKFKEVTSQSGAQFVFNREVTGIRHNKKKIVALEIERPNGNGKEEMSVEYLFSSMPLPNFVKSMVPSPPENILQAASRLRFRSFLTVNVILNKKNIFPDQWIYVHSPEVRLGRIQNYKNWSPAMTIDPEKTSLGLEYFCNEGDELWEKEDIELIDTGLQELERIGLVSRQHFITGFVVRRKDVYPVYTLDYRKHLALLRSYLDEFSNLQFIGRAGLFRYSNSDHAMLTGLLAAENFLNHNSFDIWSIGTEQEYLEEIMTPSASS